jgi:hypothetical protein
MQVVQFKGILMSPHRPQYLRLAISLIAGFVIGTSFPHAAHYIGMQIVRSIATFHAQYAVASSTRSHQSEAARSDRESDASRVRWPD